MDDVRRALRAITAVIDAGGGGTPLNETAWASYAVQLQNGAGTSEIGNGTLTGKWKQWGKTVLCRVTLVPGTTTGATANPWFFTLPVGCEDDKGIIGAAFYSYKYDDTLGWGIDALNYPAICRTHPLYAAGGASRMAMFLSHFNGAAVLHDKVNSAFPQDTTSGAQVAYAEMTLVYPTSEPLTLE